MRHHEMEETCPHCGNDLALTTEWGWIDEETCTAVLCCPVCRTEQAHRHPAVLAFHIQRLADENRDETEARAVRELLARPRGWLAAKTTA